MLGFVFQRLPHDSRVTNSFRVLLNKTKNVVFAFIDSY